ncbi:MAG: M20/M25/M40 family metallo-hydrolase [Planctomycetes bacterium]|nr:M20/M25/M40 family metallo-hydrolase [Planctomycetota bacterium]MCB9891717.1 M20/M25/M40 family metallo-hydrolase [Planctomycetota bacterium]
MIRTSSIVALLAALAVSPSVAQDTRPDPLPLLVDRVIPEKLAEYHERFAHEPHRAATPGDARTIESLVALFTEFGLEVERHDIWPYLAYPGDAELAILGEPVIALPLREQALDVEPHEDDPFLTFGWNAWSGTGTAEADVVYVNRGRKEDFERLAELGVSVEGKIAIARYGGNYRGYKAYYAERSGAAGLLIFTDPKDSGSGRGKTYPDGGYANDTYIQRGSILTLPYPGDPLTPGHPADEDAERLDSQDVAFPRIPVQPIGWRAAREILSRLQGATAPDDWQGGDDAFPYRLGGATEPRVRLHVSQERRVGRTANVVGILRGTEEPASVVVLGCHHDAWGFGACDPTCGLICIAEAARILTEARDLGMRPRRSIAFAAWAAEEHGIIGSTEWVERHLPMLRDHALAYVNLDMAAMGKRFGASCSPMVRGLLQDAARSINGPNGEDCLLEAWAGTNEIPHFGTLGGGSDHVGFLALAGVPCIGMGTGGTPGTCYHSVHDTLTWYRRFVGADYASASLVTNMAIATAWRLADAYLLPFDPSETLATMTSVLTSLPNDVPESARERWTSALAPLIERSRPLADRLRHAMHRVRSDFAAGSLREETLQQVNATLMQFERAWLLDEGLPDRPWFRNHFAAPDETSGYAAWVLPGLRWAAERPEDEDALDAMVTRYETILRRLNELTFQLVW